MVISHSVQEMAIFSTSCSTNCIRNAFFDGYFLYTISYFWTQTSWHFLFFSKTQLVISYSVFLVRDNAWNTNACSCFCHKECALAFWKLTLYSAPGRRMDFANFRLFFVTLQDIIDWSTGMNFQNTFCYWGDSPC